MPDIHDLLETDHAKVKKLLAEIKETGDSAEKTRDKLFAEIKADLDLHTEFEEKVFYPKARKATGMDDEIKDDLEEHAEAKEMLEKLSSLKSTTVEWMKTMDELADALAHHIKDEETKLFPQSRKKIEAAEAEKMGKQYKQKKEKAAG